MPISTLTSDGLSIACLLLQHDWTARLSVAHNFPVNVTRGVSGREGRSPGDEALRFTAAVHLQLEPTDADALRQKLATLGKGFVGIPLWMDQLLEADWSTAIYDPERLIDLTSPAIVNKGSSLTSGHTYAPLLVGHIDELPPLTPLDDQHCELTFTLIGDAPWDLRIGINATGTSGTWPASLVPDWTSSPVDTPEHGLRFEQVGDQRERTIEGEEQAFRWSQEADFWLSSRTEVRTLLAFFLASQGPRMAFDQPWWFKPGTATAETPHTTKARFESNVLTLDYFTDADATAKVKVTQVPWEIAGIVGEVPAQPALIHYYKIVYALPTPVTYRFTSWPRPLARSGDGTYTPAPFRHRKLTGTLDLRGNQLSVDSFIFSGNPLTLFHPDVREAPVYLTVLEGESDPIAPDSAVIKWVGEIKSSRSTGRKLDAACVFIGQILDRQLPNVILGPVCNTRLFSTRCGLVKATFDKTGTFTSVAGNVLTIATAAADTANTFAHGSIEVGSGASWEVRSIVSSAPITGGQEITVDFPVRQVASGQAVLFARGCDLSYTTCKALGNGERFRGHPFRPTTNLSLPVVKAPGAPAKK